MTNIPSPPPPQNPDSWSRYPSQPPVTGSPTAMTGWTTLGTGEQVELAGVGARFGARIIDVSFFVVLLFVIIAVLLGSNETSSGSGLTAGLGITLILGYIAFMFLYEAATTAIWGRTLGKQLVGIHVARSDNGMLPGWGKSFGRWGLPTVVSVIPGVGFLVVCLIYLSILWSDSRQGWHDKAAGTVVRKGLPV